MKKLTKLQDSIIHMLPDDVDIEMNASDIKINDIRSVVIGKQLFLLQRLGLVSSVKNKGDKTYRWSITEYGIEYRKDNHAQEIKDHVYIPSQRIPSQRMKVTSVGRSDIPPTTPDHFVFVVSEQQIISMLSSRLGVSADEVSMLRQRVRTLEQTLIEYKKQVDLFKRERDTALEMAESLEDRINQIDKALKGVRS